MAAGIGSANPSELFIGLMSGTSLDGVDAVLADFSLPTPRVLAHVHRPFPSDLRAELLALSTPGPNEIERSGAAARQLAALYADCVAAVLESAQVPADCIRAIGAHGQTIRHRPDAGFSAQLNSPAGLAEATGIDVVADFRSRDIAAGGQGAPLVPAFHAVALAAPWPRAVVNIGGISNITFLRGDGLPPIGFDCGPGNILLDLHAARHLPQAYDRDGALALRGRSNDELLARFLAEPFLESPPPKSTGRELFSASWLDARLQGVACPPQDVQRSLTEYTARSIGGAIERWCASARDVVVCGGGARNPALMASLAYAAAPRPVRPSEEIGIPADQVEALTFAWLARRCVARETGSLPTVTGARGARVLGAIYPR